MSQTPTGVMFDMPTARRVVAATRTVERSPRPPAGGPPSAFGGSGLYYAKIVGESTAKPGHYSWKIIDRDDGDWVDRDPRVFDSGCSAMELNGATGIAADTVVRLWWVGETTDPYPTDPSPAPDAAGDDDTDVKVTDTPYPAFMFEVGGALPKAQYQYQMFGMVSQNQTGFTFILAHPMVDDQTSSGGT